MNKFYSSGVWLLLTLSLTACMGVFYAGYAIREEALARASEANTAGQESDKAAYNQRIRALASDTKAERERLDQHLQLDIVSLINTLESAARSIKLSALVSDVSPEGSPVTLADGSSVQKVSFTISAGGSYTDLMHLISMYEHIPLPSEVRQIELEHIPGDKSATWRLILRIKVYTTAPISS